MQMLNARRYLGNCRKGEQIAQRQLDCKRLAHAGNKPHSQERIAAELEEIIFHAHTFDAKDL